MDISISDRFSSHNPINKLASLTLELDHIACKNNHSVSVLHRLSPLLDVLSLAHYE